MSDSSPSSTSLLDLLTCGLGGVLLMFMVVLILAQRLEFRQADTRRRARGEDVKSAFVLLARVVEPPRDGSPRRAAGKTGRLVFVSESAGSWSPTIVSAPDYGLLYGDHPPPKGASVRLQWQANEGVGDPPPMSVRLNQCVNGEFAPICEPLSSPNLRPQAGCMRTLGKDGIQVWPIEQQGS